MDGSWFFLEVYGVSEACLPLPVHILYSEVELHSLAGDILHGDEAIGCLYGGAGAEEVIVYLCLLGLELALAEHLFL